MKPKYIKSFHILIPALLTIVFIQPSASAATVKYRGINVALAPTFQKPMQCVLDSLQKRGYKIGSVGCFGTRPNNRSAHPTGHACDVDQTGYNITKLNKAFSRQQQVQLAQGCNAASGCKWRRPDCGHFEQRSAPYSRAGAKIRQYRYKKS